VVYRLEEGIPELINQAPNTPEAPKRGKRKERLPEWRTETGDWKPGGFARKTKSSGRAQRQRQRPRATGGPAGSWDEGRFGWSGIRTEHPNRPCSPPAARGAARFDLL
jgi:hypothetical protein